MKTKTQQSIKITYKMLPGNLKICAIRKVFIAMTKLEVNYYFIIEL